MTHVGFGFGMMGLFGALSPKEDKPPSEFEELAMPLLDSLYNFARWLAPNQTDAEDLVQETFLKALRSFASFEPGTNFRAWMFRILKNTFLSSCAKLEKRVTVAIDAMPDAQDLAVEHETPHTILVKRCDSQIVMRTINDLPVHFRQVLFLCEVEDMSYQEIADVLSIPIGTVMSRLARARQVLRKSVGITRSVLLPVNNHSTRFSTASSRNGR